MVVKNVSFNYYQVSDCQDRHVNVLFCCHDISTSDRIVRLHEYLKNLALLESHVRNRSNQIFYNYRDIKLKLFTAVSTPCFLYDGQREVHMAENIVIFTEANRMQNGTSV